MLIFVASTIQLLFDEQPDSDCPSCESTIAITDSDAVHSIAGGVISVIALGLVLVVLGIVVTRFVRAKGALRRALGPCSEPERSCSGSCSSSWSWTRSRRRRRISSSTSSSSRSQPCRSHSSPACSAAGWRGVGVADLLVELGRGAPLRDALAHALRDPSLDLVYWLPDRAQLVYPDGTEFRDDGGTRLRHDVQRNGQLVGALIHDPSLADEPELVDAVAAAAALWLENERLQAEVRAQFVFLETIVNTAPRC